jgi:hypothetical protein
MEGIFYLDVKENLRFSTKETKSTIVESYLKENTQLYMSFGKDTIRYFVEAE